MIAAPGAAASHTLKIQPKQVWLDTEGHPINAHGGGVMHHGDVYYWYGECRPEGPSSLDALIGVSCYSSHDLLSWKNEGVALSVVPDDSHPLAAGCKIERPKVVHNPRTGKFVMWWHHDIKGCGHDRALAGVAVSDTPTGPFEFLKVLRPNWLMARDCTLFQDDDGTAYFIHASDDNANLVICRLSDDYLEPTTTLVKAFPGRYMEAPCVFKHVGVYYLIGSDCTGWQPNEARSAFASSIWGDWKEFGNPCLGEGAETTYGAQSTFVLPVAGKPGAFIFMADAWRSENLADSRYVWLPVTFRAIAGYPAPRPFVRWHDAWDLSVFDHAAPPASEL